MSKHKVINQINLEKLAGGAFAEKLNEALMQVAENIQNPNTEATNKRQINIVIKFAPNKSRQIINTQISVTTKLAATEAIDTQMVMGLNIRTGQIEIAEYDGQIRGQMNLFNETEEEETIRQAIQSEGPTETAEEQVVHTGKPLDLRKRNQKPDISEEKPQTVSEERQHEKYVDPDTGEIYESVDDSLEDNGQAEQDSKVVIMKRKNTQA